MNKKEIRIDLLPEDFKKDLGYLNCGNCLAAQAIKRTLNVKEVAVDCGGVDVFLEDGTKSVFNFKEIFGLVKYNEVKSQYEKGTNTIYYITLIPQ